MKNNYFWCGVTYKNIYVNYFFNGTISSVYPNGSNNSKIVFNCGEFMLFSILAIVVLITLVSLARLS